MYEIMNFNLYNRNEIFTAPIKTIEIKFTLLTSIFPWCITSTLRHIKIIEFAGKFPIPYWTRIHWHIGHTFTVIEFTLFNSTCNIIRFPCIIISYRFTVLFLISNFTRITCTVTLFLFLDTTLYGSASKFDGIFLHRCFWRTLSPSATPLKLLFAWYFSSAWYFQIPFFSASRLWIS